MNGAAMATAIGTANGLSPDPPRPLASHQLATNRSAAPRKTAPIESDMLFRPSS